MSCCGFPKQAQGRLEKYNNYRIWKPQTSGTQAVIRAGFIATASLGVDQAHTQLDLQLHV